MPRPNPTLQSESLNLSEESHELSLHIIDQPYDRRKEKNHVRQRLKDKSSKATSITDQHSDSNRKVRNSGNNLSPRHSESTQIKSKGAYSNFQSHQQEKHIASTTKPKPQQSSNHYKDTRAFLTNKSHHVDRKSPLKGNHGEFSSLLVSASQSSKIMKQQPIELTCLSSNQSFYTNQASKRTNGVKASEKQEEVIHSREVEDAINLSESRSLSPSQQARSSRQRQKVNKQVKVSRNINHNEKYKVGKDKFIKKSVRMESVHKSKDKYQMINRQSSQTAGKIESQDENEPYETRITHLMIQLRKLKINNGLNIHEEQRSQIPSRPTRKEIEDLNQKINQLKEKVSQMNSVNLGNKTLLQDNEFLSPANMSPQGQSKLIKINGGSPIAMKEAQVSVSYEDDGYCQVQQYESVHLNVVQYVEKQTTDFHKKTAKFISMSPQVQIIISPRKLSENYNTSQNDNNRKVVDKAAAKGLSHPLLIQANQLYERISAIKERLAALEKQKAHTKQQQVCEQVDYYEHIPENEVINARGLPYGIDRLNTQDYRQETMHYRQNPHNPMRLHYSLASNDNPPCQPIEYYDCANYSQISYSQKYKYINAFERQPFSNYQNNYINQRQPCQAATHSYMAIKDHSLIDQIDLIKPEVNPNSPYRRYGQNMPDKTPNKKLIDEQQINSPLQLSGHNRQQASKYYHHQNINIINFTENAGRNDQNTNFHSTPNGNIDSQDPNNCPSQPLPTFKAISVQQSPPQPTVINTFNIATNTIDLSDQSCNTQVVVPKRLLIDEGVQIGRQKEVLISCERSSHIDVSQQFDSQNVEEGKQVQLVKMEKPVTQSVKPLVSNVENLVGVNPLKGNLNQKKVIVDSGKLQIISPNQTNREADSQTATGTFASHQNGSNLNSGCPWVLEVVGGAVRETNIGKSTSNIDKSKRLEEFINKVSTINNNNTQNHNNNAKSISIRQPIIKSSFNYQAQFGNTNHRQQPINRIQLPPSNGSMTNLIENESAINQLNTFRMERPFGGIRKQNSHNDRLGVNQKELIATNTTKNTDTNSGKPQQTNGSHNNNNYNHSQESSHEQQDSNKINHDYLQQLRQTKQQVQLTKQKLQRVLQWKKLIQQKQQTIKQLDKKVEEASLIQQDKKQLINTDSQTIDRPQQIPIPTENYPVRQQPSPILITRPIQSSIPHLTFSHVNPNYYPTISVISPRNPNVVQSVRTLNSFLGSRVVEHVTPRPQGSHNNQPIIVLQPHRQLIEQSRPLMQSQLIRHLPPPPPHEVMDRSRVIRVNSYETLGSTVHSNIEVPLHQTDLPHPINLTNQTISPLKKIIVSPGRSNDPSVVARRISPGHSVRIIPRDSSRLRSSIVKTVGTPIMSKEIAQRYHIPRPMPRTVRLETAGGGRLETYSLDESQFNLSNSQFNQSNSQLSPSNHQLNQPNPQFYNSMIQTLQQFPPPSANHINIYREGTFGNTNKQQVRQVEPRKITTIIHPNNQQNTMQFWDNHTRNSQKNTHGNNSQHNNIINVHSPHNQAQMSLIASFARIKTQGDYNNTPIITELNNNRGVNNYIGDDIINSYQRNQQAGMMMKQNYQGFHSEPQEFVNYRNNPSNSSKHIQRRNRNQTFINELQRNPKQSQLSARQTNHFRAPNQVKSNVSEGVSKSTIPSQPTLSDLEIQQAAPHFAYVYSDEETMRDKWNRQVYSVNELSVDGKELQEQFYELNNGFVPEKSQPNVKSLLKVVRNVNSHAKNDGFKRFDTFGPQEQKWLTNNSQVIRERPSQSGHYYSNQQQHPSRQEQRGEIPRGYQSNTSFQTRLKPHPASVPFRKSQERQSNNSRSKSKEAKGIKVTLKEC